MPLSLTKSFGAVGPGVTSSFQGVGGTSPYTYAVIAGGAGGTINAASGIYTAPLAYNTAPGHRYDTVQVTDNVGATATSQILVGPVISLLLDILQHELGVANDHIFWWDQKVFQPSDSSMYLNVSLPIVKAFGNVIEFNGGGAGLAANQFIACVGTFDIEALSRSTEAFDKKEQILIALQSVYSQQQQEANGFSIGRIPPGSKFLNISFVDGAAIPYRFKISVNVQYAVPKMQSVPYMDDFHTTEVTTDP